MKKPNHSGSGQIRIIGGQWRGRKLPVPDSPGLRPTTDRVRETLFNWLAPVIVDAQCLDCFAGSGALGLEALSRYAAGATLIEMDRAVSQQLIKNLATLKAGNARVVNSNAMSFLAQKGTPHNIVFVDPPFRRGLLEETINLLEDNGWLADEALINIGRLLMLCVWGFLILNLVHPFPRPLNIFVNVALIFTVLMHGMQLALLKSTLPKDGPQMTTAEKVRIFLFGVFELLVWQKKFKVKK